MFSREKKNTSVYTKRIHALFQTFFHFRYRSLYDLLLKYTIKAKSFATLLYFRAFVSDYLCRSFNISP